MFIRPVFFCGVIISLALTRSPFPVARVYGVDLLGAAMGCLGALALLNISDGPSAVLWVSAVIAAAALFSPPPVCRQNSGHQRDVVLYFDRRRFHAGGNRFAATNERVPWPSGLFAWRASFYLILATGAGSFMSERLAPNSRTRIKTWGALTVAYLIALPFALNQLFAAFDNATLAARIALCVTSITPAGLLLGFGFPTGMRLITSIDPRPTPWFWGINGAAGVLASIAAIAISLALGNYRDHDLGCSVLRLGDPDVSSFAPKGIGGCD